jgi:SRF-type transcription factor (DNA-binding and dimerisation domain)
MAINKSKRSLESLGRRKKTLFKKVHELGEYDGIDVALIIRQNGRFFTYRSINREFWPPSMKEIVRLYHLDLHIHTNVKSSKFHTLSPRTCFLKI